ncbi:N-acetylneuraminate synthase [Stappia sp. GBMRC 2046]|uniref:N-acetylneuraminate synthase n=1 Tax=Stappia sediminis TaxID=2692190 RepID=A0A7X3LUY5_9HYPH|nr:N-acetylneuraminate synthase [Stappia sediminis]MXN65574.1 N-acetylneuraminate synthase [Stappia sediminis]
MNSFKIGDKSVGPDVPCFVIAEIGVNHNGDEDMAIALIEAARDAGADAVKFQTFNADKLVTRNAASAKYQRDNTGVENQNALLKDLELDKSTHERLLTHCNRTGITFLSSPFDLESVDMLSSLGVPAFKVASPDCVSDRLLRHIGKAGKPVILSTGMCDIGEVISGVATLRKSGSDSIALLHCTSCYPAPLDEIHLRAMATIATATDLPVGYSDHSEGNAVSIAAVALGATIIEKHITLDRSLPGPDHPSSIEPKEFAQMVSGIRAVQRALGTPIKQPQPSELSARTLGRRSVATIRQLETGQTLSEQDLILLRPGTGIPPRLESTLIGRKLARPVEPLTLLSWEDLV